jgi:TonB-linked SusC/RagA family outer membrane protein
LSKYTGKDKIMKVRFILMLILFVGIFASKTHAQTNKISLKVDNISLEDFLTKIEEQSEFHFFYTGNINVEQKISGKFRNKKITEILDSIKKEAGMNYEIIGTQIVLSPITTEKGIKNSIPQNSISGTVTDETGESLPGVTVLIKGGTEGGANGTITDMDGYYFIPNVSENAVLQFSFVGMSTQEVAIAGRATINVVLTFDAVGLNEVVVVGYGTQKVKDITGSVSQISAEAIDDRPIFGLNDALAGKAAGVHVVTSSGKPQSGSFIRIRGTTSIDASSEPLYVIDGIPTEITYDLNPNDIESISILKDASAAAIYGSAGANGVVIINTKRGAGSEGVVSFNSYYGFSKVTNKMGTLNSSEYIDLMDVLGLATDWSRYVENTDWQEEIYRTAVRQNYQLSLAGSEKGTNYYFSTNWQNIEGIIRNNSADRISGKINFDRQVNNWLKAGTSLTYSKWNDVDVTDNTGAGHGGVVLGALVTPSLIPIYNEDGTFTGNPLQTSWENPVASTDAPIKDYARKRFLGSTYLEAKIIEGLKFKTRFSIDNSNGVYSYFLDPYSTDWGRVNEGLAYESTDANFFWINENLLTYENNFGKSNFKIMGGMIISKTTSHSLSVEARKFANATVKTINGGSEIQSGRSFEAERSNISYLSRVNYSFADKYLLTANFRADASSVFGPGNQVGYFPSFSAGWRLSEEPFLKEQNFFNDIKLRAGWGMVGNDRIAPYAWLGKVGPGSNYVFGGNIVPGIAPETLENQDLKWETTSQTDIGIDFKFLDYRMSFIVDAYLKNTSDLLLSVPIPTSSGFKSSIQNVGKIQNKGLEFALGGLIVDNRVKWESNFNISFNRNKIIDLKDQVIMTGEIFQRGNIVKTEEGKEMNNFWGYVAEGVDPATGDMIYKDLNNDGLINDEGDKQVIGNANPDFGYGFINTLSYKGLSLNVFIQGIYGNDVFNATRINTEGMNDFKSQTDGVLRRWKQEGDITDIPRATLGLKNNSDLSTRFIEDGSYLRIKSVSLAYTFPESIVQNVLISNAKIYLSAENLFTFTNYSGYDPEVNAFGGSNLVQGVDFGTYPQARSIIFGVNVSF